MPKSCRRGMVCAYFRKIHRIPCSNGPDCGDPGWGRESVCSDSAVLTCCFRACGSCALHNVHRQVFLRAWFAFWFHCCPSTLVGRESRLFSTPGPQKSRQPLDSRLRHSTVQGPFVRFSVHLTVAQAFPSINQSLCDGLLDACLIVMIQCDSIEYTETYERAVFSSHKFTYQGEVRRVFVRSFTSH